MSYLQKEFTTLSKIVEKNHEFITENFSNNNQLQLYSLFKQSTEGDCNINEPSILEFRKKAKYNAWKELEGMKSEVAMRNYIKKAKEMLSSN